jgi:hypothetical protein
MGANECVAQGTIADIIHGIFRIPTNFQGTLISQFAKLHLDSVVDDLNDEVLDPWADLQQQSETKQNTPLSPFTEKELLKDTDLSMDGSTLIKELGFQYVLPFSRVCLLTFLSDTNIQNSHRKKSRR